MASKCGLNAACFACTAPFTSSPISTMILRFLIRSRHGVESCASICLWRAACASCASCCALSLENLNPCAPANAGSAKSNSSPIPRPYIVDQYTAAKSLGGGDMPHGQLGNLASAGFAALIAAGCATQPAAPSDPAAACNALMVTVPALGIDPPSRDARVQSARLIDASPMSVPETGPVVPAMPRHCQVIGEIAPLDPAAPAIRFQVNLPHDWNGRAVQFGGGGFNGVLITGLAFPPA